MVISQCQGNRHQLLRRDTSRSALQAMGIQKYMFFSIHNCDKHPEVPLMQMKKCTEQYLADSGLNYTIFRLCGFMQVHCCACMSATSMSLIAAHQVGVALVLDAYGPLHDITSDRGNTLLSIGCEASDPVHYCAMLQKSVIL